MTAHVSPSLGLSDTLNEIVARYPAALPVLQRFGLDTCCGGALPLATAAEHHALDAGVLLAALAEACAAPEVHS
jgi:regulator of cell morphogenesis and NO signaling